MINFFQITDRLVSQTEFVIFMALFQFIFDERSKEQFFVHTSVTDLILL